MAVQLAVVDLSGSTMPTKYRLVCPSRPQATSCRERAQEAMAKSTWPHASHDFYRPLRLLLATGSLKLRAAPGKQGWRVFLERDLPLSP